MAIADSLRQSASVSQLTCFHIVFRNSNNRKESAKICKEGNDSELSVAGSKATWILNLNLISPSLSFPTSTLKEASFLLCGAGLSSYVFLSISSSFCNVLFSSFSCYLFLSLSSMYSSIHLFNALLIPISTVSASRSFFKLPLPSAYIL